MRKSAGEQWEKLRGLSGVYANEKLLRRQIVCILTQNGTQQTKLLRGEQQTDGTYFVLCHGAVSLKNRRRVSVRGTPAASDLTLSSSEDVVIFRRTVRVSHRDCYQRRYQ